MLKPLYCVYGVVLRLKFDFLLINNPFSFLEINHA